MKSEVTASQTRIIDEWDDGFGWIAYPDEFMKRASHAFRTDGGVWVVDPVDFSGLDDRLAELGDVKGVVVVLDRHSRDSETVAQRHDVPVYIPSFMSQNRFRDVRVETYKDELEDTGFEAIRAVRFPGWKEVALFDGETLIVGDALGTADYFTVGREKDGIGVHPALRFFPPNKFLDLRPKRILVGHGEGVMENGTKDLRYALMGARIRIPRLYVQNLGLFIKRLF